LQEIEEEERREHHHKEGSGHHSGSGHRHWGSGDHERRELTEAEKEEFNKTRHCFEEIFKKEHETLSACVDKATGFKLPKGPEHPEHRRFGHRGERHGREHDRKEGSAHHEEGSAERRQHMVEFMAKVKAALEKKWAKSCENNAAAETAVQQCLAKTLKAAEPQVKTFCDNKKTCFETYTAVKPCDRKDLEETRRHVIKAAFECKKNEGKPNFQALSNGITQCVGVDWAKLEEHHRRHGGPEGKHHEGSGEHHHSGHGSGHKGEHREEKREDPIEKLCLAVEHAKPAPKA